MPSWTNAVKNNLKLLAAGGVAVLVAGTGAAATTVTLSGSESGVPTDVVATASASPSPLGAVSDTSTVGIAPDDSADDVADASPSPSDTATVGIRPTDTHGYCVSHAVQSATATAGISLGMAKSTAAHSCPKPNQKPKRAHAPKPAKAHPAKTHPAKPEQATQHGRPAGAGQGNGHGNGRGRSGHGG